MDLKPGGAVADVGTGVGFMLPYLSHAVGDTGHVIGEDIQNDFLDKAKLKAQLSRLNNVQFVLGTDRDPKLPADSLEGVLVLDVYHHFDYPEAMLEHIRDSLLSDGKLVIVEYFKRPGAMPGDGSESRGGAYSAGSGRPDPGSGSERIPAGFEARSGAEEPVHRGF